MIKEASYSIKQIYLYNFPVHWKNFVHFKVSHKIEMNNIIS